MYKHILVPISFDNDRDSKGAVAAARLLADNGGRISLLHVIEHIPAYAISYLPQDYLTEARKAVEKELADLAATLPDATAHVIEGHSGRTILDWADENKPDCIVIASHRPGMQDLLLGSTATQVVRHARCSVHVMR
ncbi:universal stress protein [Roseovarius sp.]|uniref:universal stress protein n=1 Tax=Roseovarius sp. TaxID=1486281 RepID=UPI0026003301|nr:universal stress protein [Roseovarius sp.]